MHKFETHLGSIANHIISQRITQF